jgi:hypothetical protein
MGSSMIRGAMLFTLLAAGACSAETDTSDANGGAAAVTAQQCGGDLVGVMVGVISVGDANSPGPAPGAILSLTLPSGASAEATAANSTFLIRTGELGRATGEVIYANNTYPIVGLIPLGCGGPATLDLLLHTNADTGALEAIRN